MNVDAGLSGVGESELIPHRDRDQRLLREVFAVLRAGPVLVDRTKRPWAFTAATSSPGRSSIERTRLSPCASAEKSSRCLAEAGTRIGIREKVATLANITGRDPTSIPLARVASGAAQKDCCR